MNCLKLNLHLKKLLFLLFAAALALPCAAKDKKDDDKPDYMLVDPETAKIFPKVKEPLTLQRGLQNDVFFVKEGKLTPAILSFKVLNRNNLEVISIDEWFKVYLPEPEPCINHEKVITFFKCEGTEEMRAKLEPAIALLDKYQKPYDVVYTNFVGTIVYEDDWQVAVRVEDGRMI